MRVLLVSHRYPPRHSAGTERYAAELARRLSERGHELRVLCAEKDVSRRDLSLVERTHEGVRVHELTDNLYYEDFAQTWTRPAVDRVFAALCDEFRPDVVHFQHLMYLSLGCLTEAAARAAVVFTLHDYWLECARMGQLVHVDGTLCETVELERCGTCLARTKWRQSKLERRTGELLAALRAGTHVDLAPLAQRLFRPRAGRAEALRAEAGAPPREAAERFRDAAGERRDALREAAMRCVDRFVCPSRFLAERMRRFGLDPRRLRVVPTGVDLAPLPKRARPPRAPGARLRVTFLGSFVPLKGAHVLLEAWASLEPSLRSRGELHLFGPARSHPEYQRRLAEMASLAGARMGGNLDRAGVTRALRGTDLLVVPSLWFENLPLVVLEAQAMRTPLLVSDLGGLAEAVVEGVHGWRFAHGDAAALAARLAELLAEPDRLDRLDPPDFVPPSWDELTTAMLALYEEVRAEAGDARTQR